MDNSLRTRQFSCSRFFSEHGKIFLCMKTTLGCTENFISHQTQYLWCMQGILHQNTENFSHGSVLCMHHKYVCVLMQNKIFSAPKYGFHAQCSKLCMKTTVCTKVAACHSQALRCKVSLTSFIESQKFALFLRKLKC